MAREGLGYLIGLLGANGTYDAMFAVVLTVAFLGFAADRIYLLVMQRDAAMAASEQSRALNRAAALLRAAGWGFARSSSIVALAIAWELLARSGAVTPFMLPTLSAVLERDLERPRSPATSCSTPASRSIAPCSVS